MDAVLRLLKQTVHNNQVGITVADAHLPDLPLVYVNEAFQEMTGYSEDEMIGRNCRFLHGSDTDQPALAELRDALRTRRACKLILRNYRKNGEMFYNLLSLLPVTNDANIVTHYVGIQQEVTNLKRDEELIDQTNAMYAARLQTVSHDLRNPLQAISIIVSVLEKQRDHLSDDMFAHRLASLKKAVQRMNDIISKILQASDAPDMALDSEKVDFCLKLEAVLEEYAEVAVQKRLSLRYAPPNQTYFVKADRVAVIEVLDNLISNAIKYSPPHKTVDVRLSQVGDVVRCEIADEGQGFSEEDKKRLFQPFATLSAKPTGGESSIGLGLSIVKRLMDKMNGSIRCESEFGKGATMIIELPVWHEEL